MKLNLPSTLSSLLFTSFLLVSCGAVKKNNSLETFKHSYSTYYSNVAKADSLFAVKKYSEAYSVFNETFSKYKPLNTFSFREYTRYVISKHLSGKEVSKNEVERLISEYGGTSSMYLHRDPSLQYLLGKYKISKSDIDSLSDSHVKSLDMDLRNKLFKAIEEDQYYRTYYDGKDKQKLWAQSDSINEKILVDLFDKNIFPNEKIIGPKFYKGDVVDVEVLLLHTNDSMRINYFLPKIKEFIHKGKCTPRIYAMMVDQYHLYNDRPQLYGTYNTEKILPEKYSYYNENRKKLGIGLPSIEFDVFWQNYLINLWD
ncbi:hypothetical protein [Tenacibaculum singaporense]|uniref:Lipoprotein n=1 Tax=Tenacibaculum singaporense TaxID=2358479 RepID=A0A3Q8RTM4_9FLAO|nr:hypothetical protein [Tenacibaculum singaporense]AZJ36192.1 hypothetical protein D6T69_11890 [Tenacibaculum singaporense]